MEKRVVCEKKFSCQEDKSKSMVDHDKKARWFVSGLCLPFTILFVVLCMCVTERWIGEVRLFGCVCFVDQSSCDHPKERT